VELLLTRDARRDAVDNRRLTALMHAAYNGHLDILDEQLFNGTQVDSVASAAGTRANHQPAVEPALNAIGGGRV
jgi:ankyrin repeat protein